jgi:polysaccharide biosynthesis PFTS motif protein
VNLYSLISNIDVAIVVPYSSVAYVADSLNTPAIYFDPNQNVIPIYEETKKITFASGKDDLKEKLKTLLF